MTTEVPVPKYIKSWRYLKSMPLKTDGDYARVMWFIYENEGLGGLLLFYPWNEHEKTWFLNDYMGYLNHHEFSDQQKWSLKDALEDVEEDPADCLGPQLQTPCGINIGKWSVETVIYKPLPLLMVAFLQ